MKDTKTSEKNSQIDKITAKQKGSKIKQKSGEKGHKKDKAVGQEKKWVWIKNLVKTQLCMKCVRRISILRLKAKKVQAQS